MTTTPPPLTMRLNFDTDHLQSAPTVRRVPFVIQKETKHHADEDRGTPDQPLVDTPSSAQPTFNFWSSILLIGGMLLIAAVIAVIVIYVISFTKNSPSSSPQLRSF